MQAVIRETMEEAAYEFRPEFLLGVYQWKHAHNDITYLRFAFIGKAGRHFPMQELDDGIVQAVWMDIDEMRDKAGLMRSPQVLTCVEDYLEGKRFPLDVITNLWVSFNNIYPPLLRGRARVGVKMCEYQTFTHPSLPP